jgi:hypothetical protein
MPVLRPAPVSAHEAALEPKSKRFTGLLKAKNAANFPYQSFSLWTCRQN